MMDGFEARRRLTASRREGLRGWPNAKEDFVRELGRRLELLAQGASVLRHSVAQRSRGQQVELREELANLRQQALQLHRALEAFRQEDGYAWLHFRCKAEARWEELFGALTDAMELYRKTYPREPRRGGFRGKGIASSSARPGL
jgi:hypothetical protein